MSADNWTPWEWCRIRPGVCFFSDQPHEHRYQGDVIESRQQNGRSGYDPCPAWADGQHCYQVVGGGWKRCACGKTVERTRQEPKATP